MLLLNKQVSKLLHYSKKCNANNIVQVLNHQFGLTTTISTIRQFHSNEKFEQEAAPSNTQEALASLERKLGKNRVVKLNIGGEKYFTTTLTTLKRIPDTFFTGYFNEQFNPQPESTDNAYFIDRPSKHFELILNYLRGINITEKVVRMNDDDLHDFIEEAIHYQLTPMYDILPPKGKKYLKTKYSIEGEGWFVKFDPNYCSSNITLESRTRARCNQPSDGCSVLGTISKSFKVKLIFRGQYLMIGFAPKSIDVNNFNYRKCGYYLYCADGNLYSQDGDFCTRHFNRQIEDGSIVECLLDKENGTITYKVDGKSYAVAYSNIRNCDELFPSLDAGVEGCTFELLEVE